MALDETFSLLAHLCRILQRSYALQKFLIFIVGPFSFDFRMCQASFYRNLPALFCTTRIMSEVIPSSSPLSSNSSLCLHESRQNNRYTDKRSRYNFFINCILFLRKYIFSSYNLSSSPDSFP